MIGYVNLDPSSSDKYDNEPKNGFGNESENECDD